MMYILLQINVHCSLQCEFASSLYQRVCICLSECFINRMMVFLCICGVCFFCDTKNINLSTSVCVCMCVIVFFFSIYMDISGFVSLTKGTWRMTDGQKAGFKVFIILNALLTVPARVTSAVTGSFLCVPFSFVLNRSNVYLAYCLQCLLQSLNYLFCNWLQFSYF